MIKRIIKFLFFTAIITVVLTPITAVFVDDDAVLKILQDIPGGTEQTDTIILQKRILASTIINYADDVYFSLELIILELFKDALSKLELTFLGLLETYLPDKSQKKVVIYLPAKSMTNPQPRPVSLPAQLASKKKTSTFPHPQNKQNTKV